MEHANQFGIPGQSTAFFSYAAQILWGGDESRIEVLRANAVIDGASRDVNNGDTPNVLRPGLLMGKVTATGKYKPYDPDADDGTEAIAGVLEAELIMTQPISGSDADRFGPVIVKAPVKASSLLVEGNPLIGSADEVAARAGLNAKRFAIDDEFC